MTENDGEDLSKGGVPEGLAAQIMKEVTRYNDGMGCTRRQLVDNILILFQQSDTRASVAPPGDAQTERCCVLNLIERFQRDSNRAYKTMNALEWLRRQIEEGNHAHHAFDPPPAGAYREHECFRCGLPKNAVMHMAYVASSPVAPSGTQQSAEDLLQDIAHSGIEFNGHADYVVVQIDRDVWERVRETAKEKKDA